MPTFRDLPLARKLTAITVLICGVALLVAFIVFGVYDRTTYRKEMTRDLAILADEFDDNVAPGLVFMDTAALQKTLQTLAANPHILAAAVYDQAGVLYASFQRPDLGGHFVFPVADGTAQHFVSDRIDTFKDIELQGERIGSFYVASDLIAYQLRLRRFATMAAGLLGGCSLFALFLAFRLQRVISDPIVALATTTERVATQKDYGLRAVKHGNDEVGLLVDGFNNMLVQIQARDRALHAANANLEQRVLERTAELAETSGLLEGMLENSPDLIYFKDRQSGFKRFSKACLPRLGLTDPAQLVGKTDADFFDTEHAQLALADEQEIIRTGKPIIGKLEKEIHPDNRVGWVLTTKMPWRNGAGEIVGTFGISKDVTAWKEAEAGLQTEIAERRRVADELKASDAFLHSLMENLPVCIYRKDLDGRFVFANSRFCAIVARPPEEIVGRTDFDLSPPEVARKYLDDDGRVIATRQQFQGEEPHVRPDGTMGWVQTLKVALLNSQDQVVGTQGMFWDVTELKRAANEVQRLNSELIQVSRQAGMAEIATGVLHNVGNVLNSVNVSATLVADQIRQTKAQNVGKLASLFAQHKTDLATFLTQDSRGRMIPGYLDTLAQDLAAERATLDVELDGLKKNVEHIKEIVAMQQSYARNSGVLETISVPDIVEDAVRINAGSFARHSVELVRDYQARPVITTDKHKVIQILINLLRNAKYACDESGRTDKKIVLRITADSQAVRIVVSDNGVGIPEENLSRIFNHGFTTRAHGHGFGLHNAALSAKQLRGALLMHSAGRGQGATFTLELPYQSTSPLHDSSN